MWLTTLLPALAVRYPSWGAGYLGAKCPTGFERRLPSILYVASFAELAPY